MWQRWICSENVNIIPLHVKIVIDSGNLCPMPEVSFDISCKRRSWIGLWTVKNMHLANKIP